MLTPFGQIVRKKRIDKFLTLKEMADALGVSSAFLSAVEMGRKSISSDLIQKISRYFDLTLEEEGNFIGAADLSKKEVKIGLEGLSPYHREAAVLLARRFSDLSAEEMAGIKKIIEDLEAKKK